MRQLNRLAVLLLCLGMMPGTRALCEGWAATPDDRMACCSDGGDCPMHKRESHETDSGRPLTQVEADACCAQSEHERSNPSTLTFIAPMPVAVAGHGVLLPAGIPALVRTDDWRTHSPIPIPPVPKHVLLSVFLV